MKLKTLPAAIATCLALACSTASANEARGRDLAGAPGVLLLDRVASPLFFGAPDSHAAAGALSAVTARIDTLRQQDVSMTAGFVGLPGAESFALEPLVPAQWWSASQIGKLVLDTSNMPPEAETTAMVRALVRGRKQDVASHRLFFVSVPLDVARLVNAPVAIDKEGHFELTILRNPFVGSKDREYVTSEDAELNFDVSPGAGTHRPGVSLSNDDFAIGVAVAGHAGVDIQNYRLRFVNLRGLRIPAGIVVTNAKKYRATDQLRFAIAFERTGTPLRDDNGHASITQSVIARYAFVYDETTAQVLDGPIGMRLDGQGDDSRLLYVGPANCTKRLHGFVRSIPESCLFDTNLASKGRILQSETKTMADYFTAR